MRLVYDPKVDAAYIRFKKGKFQVITYRLSEDIAINYDSQGCIVGIEILDGSKYLLTHKKQSEIKLENLSK